MLQMEAVMGTTIMRDAHAVHETLAARGDEVRLSVSRETAELVARVVDARARAEQVFGGPSGSSSTAV